MATIGKQIIWHSHDERPVYESGGDNRLITCLDLLQIRTRRGINVCYLDLNPDGSLNECCDIWHSRKWLKRHAIHWEHMHNDTWWTYVRDLTPDI